MIVAQKLHVREGVQRTTQNRVGYVSHDGKNYYLAAYVHQDRRVGIDLSAALGIKKCNLVMAPSTVSGGTPLSQMRFLMFLGRIVGK